MNSSLCGFLILQDPLDLDTSHVRDLTPTSSDDAKAKKKHDTKAHYQEAKSEICNFSFQGDTANFAAHVGSLAQCADDVEIINGLSTKYHTPFLRCGQSGSNKVDLLWLFVSVGNFPPATVDPEASSLATNKTGTCIRNPCTRYLFETIPVIAAVDGIISVETTSKVAASAIVIDMHCFPLGSNDAKGKTKLTPPGMVDADVDLLAVAWANVVVALMQDLLE